MIRLTANSLTKTGRFRPETMGLNLEERSSTATMTLPIDGEQFAVGNWLQDDCNPGSGIVWRVRSIDRKYERKTQTVTLEHLINSLKDKVMFGDVDASMMSGTLGATTCTAKQAVQYILAQQSDWTLGDFAYNVSNPYSFSSDTLYDALETVSSTLEDCIWEYDFSTYPFKIHFRHLSDDVTSEMRMSRNISTLQITVDRNGMYTRFYPIGKNNLKLSGGGYVSKNEPTWGTICKVEVDQSLDTTGKLTAWANIRLNKHAEPLINVTISGLDLSESTGESLDSFTIGKKCRVPLPEYSTTVTERVTKLSWQDKLNRREEVKVTLANKLADVATILKEQAAAAGGGGIAGAKNKEEDHAWFVDTTERVGMVAEAVAGSIDGHPNWSRVSELMVDGNGIDARVTVAEGELVTQEARITVTENSISTLVTKTGINDLGQNETLSSRITQTADAIQAEVTRASSAEGTLSGQITVQAGQISQIVHAVGRNGEVTAASIVLAINSSGSGAYINADRIILSGSTSINDVMYITSGGATAFGGQVAFLNTVSAYQGVTLIGLSPITVTASNMATAIQKAEVTGSGANMTLKLTTFDGSEINFTKAATTSLTESWSNGTITVEAQPSGVRLQRTLGRGTITWSGNTATVPINATWGSGTTYTESTGWNVTVDASARYTAGYNSAHLSGSWGTGTNSNLFTVTKVQSGSSNSLAVRVKASISYNSSTHKYTAAALANDAQKATAESGTEAYDAGWSAGRTNGINSVTVSSVGQNGSASYNSSTKVYSIPIIGTASNSATKTGTISLTATAAFNAGWNAYRAQLLSVCGNQTHLYYPGTWFDQLFYRSPVGSYITVYNCVGGATGFDIPAAK